jgi:hypothetical protein
MKGNVLATLNEMCHDYRSTVAAVKLRELLAPFPLQSTESLAIFAERYRAASFGRSEASDTPVIDHV